MKIKYDAQKAIYGEYSCLTDGMIYEVLNQYDLEGYSDRYGEQYYAIVDDENQRYGNKISTPYPVEIFHVIEE